MTAFVSSDFTFLLDSGFVIRQEHLLEMINIVKAVLESVSVHGVAQ